MAVIITVNTQTALQWINVCFNTVSLQTWLPMGTDIPYFNPQDYTFYFLVLGNIYIAPYLQSFSGVYFYLVVERITPCTAVMVSHVAGQRNLAEYFFLMNLESLCTTGAHVLQPS